MAEIIYSKEELLKKGVALYESIFNEKPDIAASAPGRVNLIGEHTDYNDGFVLPMALPLVTMIVGKANSTSDIFIYTDADVGKEPKAAKFNSPTESNLLPGKLNWANYVKGSVNFFDGEVPGFNAVIVSSVPMGGGLSSSASLEVATYTFLETLTGKKTDLKQKAFLCQQAEHKFANVPCGIMDQFIAVLGKIDSALFLDCETKNYELVPLNRTDIVILVINSNVAHFLNSSDEYATRKSQCMEAAKAMGVESLRKATLSLLEAHKNNLNETTFKRARHVITEIQRTESAAQALKKGDYNTFGSLMNESHFSLRDDYDVSCPELDQLVDIALKCEGVFGSRMTGGGFGGCTVTLLKYCNVSSTIERIQEEYSGSATFYIARAYGGAQDELALLKSIL
uniref:Galactokinase n=1 Tax=Riptortus pedestris TaxID=329032 RepID=R4WP75_RIPPE|nr:galactokinase [Riptortus pedestris]